MNIYPFSNLIMYMLHYLSFGLASDWLYYIYIYYLELYIHTQNKWWELELLNRWFLEIKMKNKHIFEKLNLEMLNLWENIWGISYVICIQTFRQVLYSATCVQFIIPTFFASSFIKSVLLAWRRLLQSFSGLLSWTI